MKTTKKIITISFSLFAMLWFGCKKDSDLVRVPQPVENEPEVVTTLKILFADSADAANVRSATFRDPDGDGGTGPDVFDTIRLQPNKTWYARIVLLDETKVPADSISKQIEREKNDHLFCFTPTGSASSVVITDRDGKNLPFGLRSTWRSSIAGTGFMKVSLRHQPGKKTGNCTGGDTDIEVNFTVKVE